MWQCHSATPSNVLYWAIRNLSGHFYCTSATQNGGLLWWSNIIGRIVKKPFCNNFSHKKLDFGGSTARCFTCRCELKAVINNPSNRSSISIVYFGFRSLVLWNHERYNSDGICSMKWAQTSGCAAFCHVLFGACMIVTSQYKPLIGSQMGTSQR